MATPRTDLDDTAAPNSAAVLVERILAFIRQQDCPAWLVGGYVRDLFLKRVSHDLDLVVAEGGIRLARAVARAFGGTSFVLDDERDVGRAILHADDGDSLEIDIARLRLPDLMDDLALRDFTINAIALDLRKYDARQLRVLDPFDGRADLQRRLVRAVTEGTFRDDPLRMLRGVRMVAELGFSIEDATFNLIRRDAVLIGGVSPERTRDELMRILVAPCGWKHLRLLNSLGLLQYVLPESAAQVGVTQSVPHYQDAFDHSRSVLAHLEGLFSLLWPMDGYARPAVLDDVTTVAAPEKHWAALAEALEPFANRLRMHLMQPLAAGHPRRSLLMWAAVMHDWGKPARRTVDEEGLVHFYDHDHWGALLAQARAQALRFSGDEIAYVARLTDLHMRPTHLAHDDPPSRRAVYRFYRDAGNTGPDCVLLSLADHLATRANAPDEESWRHRLSVTVRLLQAFFDERGQAVDPEPLLDGRQVMAGLNLSPGRRVGELLEGLRERQATGEVATLDEAWAWLRTQALVAE